MLLVLLVVVAIAGGGGGAVAVCWGMEWVDASKVFFNQMLVFLHQNSPSHFLKSSFTNDPWFHVVKNHQGWPCVCPMKTWQKWPWTPCGSASTPWKQRKQRLEGNSVRRRRPGGFSGLQTGGGCLAKLGANIKGKTILWINTWTKQKNRGKQCDDIRRDWNKSVRTKKSCNSKAFPTTSHQATLSPAIMEVKKGCEVKVTTSGRDPFFHFHHLGAKGSLI